MKYKPKEEFKKIAEQVLQNGTPYHLTPKDLLGFFNASRRTSQVIQDIDNLLSKGYKLKTDPDYKSEYLHADILLKRDSDNSEKEDFIPRIKLLKAANNPPMFVTKNCKIEKAFTKMMTNDFSQLPVMQSQESKTVDGVISWSSIGWAKNKGKVEIVSHGMKTDVIIVDYEKPLLDAIEIIKRSEFVLVRKKDKTISGLVTVTDIAEEFFELTQPFVLIGQIENSLRVLLHDKFSLQELNDIKYGADSRNIESVSDLTFSEYIELMRKGTNWTKIGFPLDKDEFTKNLDEIRLIRNDIMHFSSDNISDQDKEKLKKTADFFVKMMN